MVAQRRALYTFFTTAGHHISLCLAQTKSPLLKALEEYCLAPLLSRPSRSCLSLPIEGVEMKEGRSSESFKFLLRKESSVNENKWVWISLDFQYRVEWGEQKKHILTDILKAQGRMNEAIVQ